jgi:hypothetical protein
VPLWVYTHGPWASYTYTNTVALPYIICLVSTFSAPQKTKKDLDEADNLKLLLHNLDLSYRLYWVGGKTVKLTRHTQELGIFQL